MSYPFKRGIQTTFVGLFCVLAFIFMIGTQGALAGGKSGCSKTCTHKEVGQGCSMMMKASTEKGSAEKESAAPQVMTLDSFSKMEQYSCPMHPEVRAQKSGKCPECGMKLVKGDFYQVYTCAMKECPRPCFSVKPGKCCGKDLQKRVMSKEEYYDLAQLQDEYFCPMHSKVVSDKAGKCPKCGMKLEMRTVQKPQDEPQEMLSYACPMHPDELSNKPGNCSKCGMKLKEYKTTSK
jgi:transcription initiation factor IIE alpha subunit